MPRIMVLRHSAIAASHFSKYRKYGMSVIYPTPVSHYGPRDNVDLGTDISRHSRAAQQALGKDAAPLL
jgi:hypothetical protein